MAKRELGHQTDVIHSARKQGGYGKKLSHRFSIGVPDLLLAVYPYVPCLVEVKDLGAVVDEFDRKLDVTPKQGYEMKLFSEPYENAQHPYTPHRRTAFVLVHILHRKEHRLVALPRAAERLAHVYEADAASWRKRQPGNFYDIKGLLEAAGICKVAL